jgi:hypothetical protein
LKPALTSEEFLADRVCEENPCSSSFISGEFELLNTLMNNNKLSPISKRTVFIIVGLTDTLLGGVILLIYFGFLPVDLSGFGIPRWIVGVVGAIWFMTALGFLVYQVTKTDISE